eukprot:gb/GFBE01042752.1/.p3 GENE.gb/GFBE01042752.1/~~gb/GFBE01042752.1/.p3  ORF type:complete len:108 (+),score=16.51 gb/GFBE01042752.1/:62-385(+)
MSTPSASRSETTSSSCQAQECQTGEARSPLSKQLLVVVNQRSKILASTSLAQRVSLMDFSSRQRAVLSGVLDQHYLNILREPHPLRCQSWARRPGFSSGQPLVDWTC